MNGTPTNPGIRAAVAAPAAEPTQTQTTMLTAKQARESPLFAGSDRLPTREMAARTVVMPPLTFSSTYELAAQTIEMPSPTITGTVENVQRQELTELDLVLFPK